MQLPISVYYGNLVQIYLLYPFRDTLLLTNNFYAVFTNDLMNLITFALMEQESLVGKIRKLALQIGFADMGCAKAQRLSFEAERFMQAQQQGFFGQMEYLKRNFEKRTDPTLLVEGAKSVLVFLAPFGSGKIESKPTGNIAGSSTLKISEFAYGADYHTVIKERLNRVAYFIDSTVNSEHNTAAETVAATLNTTPNFKKYKSLTCRVFTDSAPIMERAWAVKAGLGFIGKNNFLISPTCGVKNFIGVIITTVEIEPTATESEAIATTTATVAKNKPLAAENERNLSVPSCGNCTLCIEACSQKALFAPRSIDARKCLSYKTIEEPLGDSDDKSRQPVAATEKWIFGCDCCMNICPWNRFNKEGWSEFRSNYQLLSTKGATAGFWKTLTEEQFKTLFGTTPLMRAGIKKIIKNIERYEDNNTCRD